MDLIKNFIKHFIKMNYPKIGLTEIHHKLGFCSYGTVHKYYQELLEDGWDFSLIEKMRDESPEVVQNLIKIASDNSRPHLSMWAKNKLEDIFRGYHYNPKYIHILESKNKKSDKDTEILFYLRAKGYNKTQVCKELGRSRVFINSRWNASAASLPYLK